MNDGPKRLLCIVSEMNVGGAETFLMKLYRNLNKKKYQMDFFMNSQKEGYYEKEIMSMGGKVYHSVPKSKHPLRSFIVLMDIVRKEKYNHVMRISQHSLSVLDLIAAKLGGASILVYRSSNSDLSGGRVNRFLHKLFKWLPKTIPTVKIAPSTEAAEFVFGKNCIGNKKATLVKNAICLDSFQFSNNRRNKIRNELNINGKFVVGHVGRFDYQKNHSFLVDVFNDIVKIEEKSILLLVGKGELENKIRNKIEVLGLTDKVVFTGVRSDIPDVMMAMDVFVFPSFFEGMPNVVIEAQATGLPCILSDTITKEARIIDEVKYMSLNDDACTWARNTLEYKNNLVRKSMKSCFIKNGYDIDTVTREVENLIFNFQQRGK